MDLESGARREEGAEAKAGGREAAGRLAQRAGSRLPIVERLPQMTRKSPANKKNEHALSPGEVIGKESGSKGNPGKGIRTAA